MKNGWLRTRKRLALSKSGIGNSTLFSIAFIKRLDGPVSNAQALQFPKLISWLFLRDSEESVLTHFVV